MKILENKWFYIALVLIGIALLSASTVKADTGTYEITKQRTDLYVQTSGDVIIGYDVIFKVTGGNIPWVTIGLPNSNFDVNSWGGAATSVTPQNQGSWNGVYINLDKTYYVGDSFEFSFNATQHNFVYQYGDNASIQFTPNWWDNAVTDDLSVVVWLPPEIHSVTTSSQPTQFMNSSILWDWQNVGNGQQETIGVIMPLDAFPNLSNPSQENPSQNIPTGGNPQLPVQTPDYTWIWILGGAAFLGALVLSLTKSHYDSPSLSVDGNDNFTRHLNMKCPNDDNDLHKRDIKGVTIDFCDKCGGAWYDKGEIETLIRRGVDEDKLNINGAQFTGKIAKYKRLCPRCEEKLHKKTRTYKKTDKVLTIFICEECEGIWLDRNSYQGLKDVREDQEKEQKKKRDDDGGWFPIYWWFFYPHIISTGPYSTAGMKYGGGSSGGAGAGGGYSGGGVSCACVSCACVSSCACACACAGGGAAGCSPKNKYHQIDLWKCKITTTIRSSTYR
jgi:Zn-finger nucleic acid-binding protein